MYAFIYGLLNPMNLRVFLVFLSKVCTKQPIITLAICLIAIIIFSCGVFYINITTDPIELWSSANSRARREKDYFDETFGPFYRTAQIFIKPTYESSVMQHLSHLNLNFASKTLRNI